MIRLFGNTRKKLLTQRKVAKYTTYAIGEILLVVIGILIALQVNNWNEVRKDRSFELKMLNEVHKAILFDQQHFEAMLQRMERLDHTANFMVKYIIERKPMHDSLRNRIFDLNAGISTQYNNGPYSAIKASGIDKISNDSLRNRLINFYDFQFPNFINILEHFHRNHVRDIETIVGYQNDPKFDTINGKSVVYQEFSQDMLMSSDFHRTLRSILFRSTSLMDKMNEFLPVMDEMAKQIQNELDR